MYLALQTKRQDSQYRISQPFSMKVMIFIHEVFTTFHLMGYKC